MKLKTQDKMKELFKNKWFVFLFKPIFAIVSLVAMVLLTAAPESAAVGLFVLLFMVGFGLIAIEFIFNIRAWGEE
jgi:hypothetical protein